MFLTKTTMNPPVARASIGLAVLLLLAAVFPPLASAGENLVPEGSFESDSGRAKGWVAAGPGWMRDRFKVMEEGDLTFVRVNQAPAAIKVDQAVDPAWGQVTLAFQSRRSGIKPGPNPWDVPSAEVDFLDAGGESLLDHKRQNWLPKDTDGWEPFSRVYDVPAGAKTMRVLLSYKARAGDADFADLSVTAGGDKAGGAANIPAASTPAAPTPPAAGEKWYQQLAKDLEARGLPEADFIYADEASAARAFRFYGQQADRAKFRRIDAPADLPFTQAVQIENVRGTAHYWSVVYGAKPSRDARAGDTMLLAMYVRSGGSREANAVSMSLAVKDDKRGQATKDRGVYPPLPEWTLYLAPVKFNRAAAAGDWKIEIFLGGPTQVVEIGGIAALWYGDRVKYEDLPETQIDWKYEGRTSSYDDDIPWLVEARKRIAEHRMQDVAVKVVDAAGQPVDGATVEVDMTRHAFLFGSVSETDLFDPQNKKWSQSDRDQFKKTFLELFNTMTIGTYKWGAWRGRWGPSFSKKFTLAATQWAHDQGLYIHGHTPIWYEYGTMPFKRGETSADEMHAGIMKWLNDLYTIPQVAEQVDSWDAINHPFGFSKLWRDYGKAKNLPAGGLELHVDELKLTRKLLPDKPLFVNEGRTLTRGAGAFEQYQDYIRYLIEQGAPLDGVGAMCHYNPAQFTSPEELIRRIDTLIAPAVERGLPMRFRVTEFDISIDRQDPAQVEIQKDYFRDFYTTLFSHPNADGIIAWGFWEREMWKPQAAWFTKDWKPLGIADEYRELVLGRWWTDLQGTTDKSGQFTGRGYKGEHRVTVTLPDGSTATAEVSLGDKPVKVTVPTPGE